VFRALDGELARAWRYLDYTPGDARQTSLALFGYQTEGKPVEMRLVASAPGGADVQVHLFFRDNDFLAPTEAEPVAQRTCDGLVALLRNMRIAVDVTPPYRAPLAWTFPNA
jgi:hypothetical protein